MPNVEVAARLGREARDNLRMLIVLLKLLESRGRVWQLEFGQRPGEDFALRGTWLSRAADTAATSTLRSKSDVAASQKIK